MSTAMVEPLMVAPDAPPVQDQRGCEWIDGQWVEKNLGAQASRVGLTANRLLDNYSVEHQLGLVFDSDAGYQIFGSNRIRKPDGSFIKRGRLPNDKPPRGHIQLVPDLVHEVISPNDLAEEVDARVMDFLKAGVKLLWVIYPATRSVYVFRPGGAMSWLTEADTLTGEDVLPGFSCRVADFFADI